MKILFLGFDATDYKERSLECRLADVLAERGHEVVFCVERMPLYREGEESKNMTIYVMPLATCAVECKSLPEEDVQKILSHEYDVIFGSSVAGAAVASAIKDRVNKPLVSQVLDIPMFRLRYEQWARQWRLWLGALLKSEMIVVNTKESWKNLEFLYQRKDLPIRLIYLGVDTETADQAPDPEEIENQMITACRLVWYKGVDLAIYAASLLENPPTFTVIGGGEEGFRLVETARFARIPIRFIGPVGGAEKFAEIKKSKFGVYSDFCEPISGLFPAEALLCKRPVIVHDMPINYDRFRDYVEFVNVFDTRAFAETIDFLSKHPDYCEERGKRGAEWIRRERTYVQQAEQLEEVLKEVAS